MPRLIKTMPSFEGVAVGAKAIARCPVGLTYDALYINYKTAGSNANEATMKSHVGTIRLLINGTEKIVLTATEVLDLYKYYGYTVQDGIIPLIFARPTMRTPVGEDELAYGTADVQTMSVEVELTGSAVTPTLTLHSVQSVGRKLGRHVTLRSYSNSIAGAGDLEYANLPRGAYGLLAVHLSSSTITDVEVLANENVAFQADVAIATQNDHLTGKVWQSGYYHVNFAGTDRIGDALWLDLQDFRIKTTHSGASTFKYIQERIDTYGKA